ncbi:MAG: filamentous hemagglutinin N-terminal domain-containing protein [Nitrospira sp.]|nr:MAG: filamentous hemagglutinin N-terminal domain-containing protein [Nitrospira sp.]
MSMPMTQHTRPAVPVLLASVMLGLMTGSAWGAPSGLSVVAGEVSASGLGSKKVTIQQATAHAVLHWREFNLAHDEVAQFIQPNSSAIALNRIFDVNPSQIFGRLEANGHVILLNPNGVMFGPTAQVNVGSLTASSLHLSTENFLAGRLHFEGPATSGPVKNAGAIEAAAGGIYLLAPNVENSGVITAKDGQITLAAGSTVYLSDRPDGRGLLVEVKAPAGQAGNLKDLIAEGGGITLAGPKAAALPSRVASSIRKDWRRPTARANETA